MFVHLASEKSARLIKRNGIKVSRATPVGVPRGVYAMAVTPNFYVSHQWLRELKASGQRTIVGVYFRLGDGESVWLGHYGQAHREMTAAEAAGVILHTENAEGFEVVVPRRIEAAEISSVRAIPQVVGWRYYPGAHGNKPCGCSYCQSGRPGAKRLRDAYEKEL